MQIKINALISAVVVIAPVWEDIDEKKVGKKETQNLSVVVVVEVLEVFRVVSNLDEKN